MMTTIEEAIIQRRRKYAEYWRDKPDSYWLMRLVQEVGELSQSLDGQHEHPIEHELEQIATIAINWREYIENRKRIARQVS